MIPDAEKTASIWLYRGFAHLYTDNLDNAQSDAEAALARGLTYRASYLLALIEIARNDPPADDPEVNNLLIDAIIPLKSFNEYNAIVFLRPGGVTLLPRTPSIQSVDYEQLYAPYLLLAERYANDDNPDTVPASIYRLMPPELRPENTN